MKSESEDQIGNTDPFLRRGIGSFPERLTEVIGTQSVRSFAEEIGLSEGAVRAFLKGRSPRADDALAIARARGIDLVWLLSGETANGEWQALQESVAVYSTDKPEEKASVDSRWADFDEEYALIDGYHIAVSAGHGSFNDQHEVKRKLAFRRKWLKFRQLNLRTWPSSLPRAIAWSQLSIPAIPSWWI